MLFQCDGLLGYLLLHINYEITQPYYLLIFIINHPPQLTNLSTQPLLPLYPLRNLPPQPWHNSHHHPIKLLF